MTFIKKGPIKLYTERNFTQKFNDTFDFAGRNWKVMLRFLTYFMLPLSIVQAMSLNAYMQSILDMQNVNSMTGSEGALIQFLANYAATVVFYLIGTTMLFGIVFSLIKMYEERNGEIAHLTFQELWPSLRRCALRALAATGTIIAYVILMIFIMVVFAMIHPAMSLIPLFGFFALCIPLSMLYPIYIFEDISIVKAVIKAFNLGFRTWGGIFAITFVTSLIIGVVSNIVSVPYTIMIILKMGFGISSEFSSFVNGPVYGTIVYILGVITIFVSYLGYAIVCVALAFQYGHAADKFSNEKIDLDAYDFDNLQPSSAKKVEEDNGTKQRLDEIDDFEKL